MKYLVLSLIVLFLFIEPILSKNSKKKTFLRDTPYQGVLTYCYPEHNYQPGVSCFQKCLNNGQNNDDCTKECCVCAEGCRVFCESLRNFADVQIYCINTCCSVKNAYDNPPYTI